MGVPKIFVVRLMEQISQLIAGEGEGGKGKERRKVEFFRSIIFLKANRVLLVARMRKKHFSSFRAFLRAKLIVAN